jgi:hypothetical protein
MDRIGATPNKRGATTSVIPSTPTDPRFEPCCFAPPCHIASLWISSRRRRPSPATTAPPPPRALPRGRGCCLSSSWPASSPSSSPPRWHRPLVPTAFRRSLVRTPSRGCPASRRQRRSSRNRSLCRRRPSRSHSPPARYRLEPVPQDGLPEHVHDRRS